MSIKTDPPEAKTYVDTKYVGLSPVTYDERGWFSARREVLVMKAGYKPTIRLVYRGPRKPSTILQKTIFRPAYLGSWYWPEEVFIELEEKAK